MCKMKVLFLALLLSLTSTFAAAEEVIFKNLAGADWPKLEAALAQSNLLKDGRFPTSALGEVAHGNVQAEKLSGSELSKIDYIALFKRHNALDESISVEEFKKRGLAGGFTLPGTLNRDIVPPVAAATPVAAPVVAPAPAAVSSLDTKALAILNGKVQELQAQIAKGGDEKRMAHLAGLVIVLQSDIKALRGNEANFAQKAELGKLSERLGGLDGRMGKVEQTLLELPTMVKTEVGTAVKPIQADVAEAKALAGGWQNWVYGLTAAVVALFALLFFAHRKTSKASAAAANAQRVSDEAKLKAQDAVQTANDAKAKAEEAKRTADNTKSEFYESQGRLVLTNFPSDFTKQVKALALGDSMELLLGAQGRDDKFRVKIVGLGDGNIHIVGLYDLDKVKAENAKSKISAAANLVDGTRRIYAVRVEAVNPTPAPAEKPLKAVPDIGEVSPGKDRGTVLEFGAGIPSSLLKAA